MVRSSWRRASSAAAPLVVLLLGALAVSAASSALAVVRGRNVPPNERRCFGAASRDPSKRCVNPALRLTVWPKPIDAVLLEPGPCSGVKRSGIVVSCRFGTPAARALRGREIALIGDSHAGHWRAPLRLVAKRERWRGTSLTRTGCSLTRAPLALDPHRLEWCQRWNRQVTRWLRRHPEVRSIFVSARARIEVRRNGVLEEGSAAFEDRVAGYLKAWDKLPASVHHIYVLRDVPLRKLGTLDCVESAMAHRRPAGTACAVARGKVLLPDPMVAAAARTRRRHVHVVDLTRHVCSRRLCLPVVGGALVNKDVDHMTTTFAATLAPYLRRRLRAIERHDRGERR